MKNKILILVGILILKSSMGLTYASENQNIDLKSESVEVEVLFTKKLQFSFQDKPFKREAFTKKCEEKVENLRLDANHTEKMIATVKFQHYWSRSMMGYDYIYYCYLKTIR